MLLQSSQMYFKLLAGFIALGSCYVVLAGLMVNDDCAAMKRLQDRGASYFILDLRDNLGGLVQVLIHFPPLLKSSPIFSSDDLLIPTMCICKCWFILLYQVKELKQMLKEDLEMEIKWINHSHTCGHLFVGHCYNAFLEKLKKRRKIFKIAAICLTNIFDELEVAWR